MNTAIATTSSTVPATSSSSPSSTTLAQYPQEVLTLVMTVEYNGFAYAGFQRQTPTPRNHGVGLTSSMITNGGNGESRKRKKPGDDIIIISSGCKHNEKNNKNNPENGIGNSKGKTSSNKRTKVPTTSPQTIQDEIEKALQQWTNLSISTLRVRGAGRTDKGVHASGQVVAFDIPLRCLLLCDGDHDDDGADGGAASESGKSVSVGIKDVTNDNKKCYDINDNDDLEFEEKISSHALTLLRKAYSQKTKKSSNATTESSAQREGKQLKSKKQENDVIDQWETRRAIATRLARDIVIRTVWIWSGDHPFEPREGILCKTYTYNMRFRSLSYIGEDVELYGQQYQQQKQLEGVGKRDNNDIKRIIHPICHAGPCLLRRINDQNTVWLSSWPLDPTLLRKACHAFVGRHDFRNFVHKRERQKMVQEMEKNESRSSTTKTTTEENPFEIDLFEFTPYFQLEGTEEWITEVVPTAAHSAFLCLPSSTFSTPPIINVRFQLRAKGFKRSMVRMLVGFVVDVARGYTNLSDIPILLMEDGDENDVDVGVIRDAGGNRIGIVNTAPACGLSLAKVEYRHNNFL